MGWRGWLRGWSDDLLSVIYPACCEVCGTVLVQGEDVMCTQCMFDLPRCNIHNESFNDVHKRLAGHVPVERAASYFHYYRDSAYRKLVHVGKYSGRPDVVRWLARSFARELAADGFFNGIDVILPVPLHRWKRLRRGYNQSEYIARGLQDVTGLAVGDNLVASRGHATQTSRGVYERWLNVRNVYSVVGSGTLKGKHLLVVDDVITSGATMLACCEAVHKAVPDAAVSVLSLGLASIR